MSKIFTKNPALTGFIQALGVIVYTSLVAFLIKAMENINSEGEIFNIVFVLTLLVFSAAISGLIVFGYPVFLVIQKKTKKALKVLGYTLFFLLILLLLVLLFIFL